MDFNYKQLAKEIIKGILVFFHSAYYFRTSLKTVLI